MSNFWQKLKKPLFTLAPMYDVTDSAFRQIITKYGKPDVFFTEFVSVDGLCSEKGREKLLRELYFTEAERPIVAQVFGIKPENFKTVAKLICELGFDGMDINMGCPDRAVLKQGAGASLIRTPELAKEIIAAAKEGAGDMPVSVKTRIGYNLIQIEEWAKTLIEAKPSAITFHMRTMKDLSKVPAQWEHITIPRDLAKGSDILIMGNGDVKDIEDARSKIDKYNIDGVMLGRAVFGNPWLFSSDDTLNPQKGVTWIKLPSIEEKLGVLIEHTKLFEDLFCPGETNQKLFNGHTKNFSVMKKHFKAYVSDFPGAQELRVKLMETQNSGEVESLIKNFLQDNQK
jgi:nifR3 family TIM-barrel protein